MQVVVTDHSHTTFFELLGLVFNQLPAEVRDSLGAPAPGRDEEEWQYTRVAPLLVERGLLFKAQGLVEDDEDHLIYYYFQLEV